ncbi:MAG: hypothetical protein U1E97_00920 [Alphaproteobacteria bacterium]
MAIQEITIQNFRAKSDTRMADAPDAALDDHLWTIAVARIVLGKSMPAGAAQSAGGGSESLIDAGIDDWGGVSSPVTPDHVNPEGPRGPPSRPWAQATAACGKTLVSAPDGLSDYVRNAGTG